jgi:hypothetical protein
MSGVGTMRSSGMEQPSNHQLALAMRMAKDGNSRAGFPSIYDSAYHALATSQDAVFITADKRHVSKAYNYGNVVLLENWKKTFEEQGQIQAGLSIPNSSHIHVKS